MKELEVGTKVKDRYVLKKLQGRGGFGEVWLAYDEILECDVAIKLYISLDSQGIEEFKSEYTTAQDLHHQNLLTPSYLDIWQHRPFLVMKYCAKGSAANFVGNMDEPMLWQFIHDVAAGLAHLHNRPEPIVHQDIKPYNVLVDEDFRFLITDFGISKKIRSTMRKQSSRATGAGATAYMGPERFEANPEPIMASDIWSLGASIYEIATGELPFSGFGGGMQKNGAEIPSLDGNWSEDMNMVMQSCLAKETWDRPTASQLEEYTDAKIKGKPAKAAWEKDLPPVNVGVEKDEIAKTVPIGGDGGGDGGGSRSHKGLVWVIIAVIVVGIIVLVVALNSGDRKVPQTPPETKPEVENGVKTEVEQSETPTRSYSADDAEDLKIALERGDYQEVIWLANRRYAPAYVPLAWYFLYECNYEMAEHYAKQAKSAGYKKEWEDVMAALKKLGYGEEQKTPEKPKSTVQPKADPDAETLKRALANGDYQEIIRLANRRYTPAYVPLAKHFLSERNYEMAEYYAKQAKSAGYKEGDEILNTLAKLGYYD